MKQLDLQYPTCPIRNVLERISDKWSLLILCSLGANERLRYKDLIAAIPDISHKMLTNSLRHLEANHLIAREAFTEIPPRVEYSLTKTGRSFLPILEQMIGWSQENFAEVTK